MGIHAYGLEDFEAIAAGAAVLASGGGGSYGDARAILQELGQQGWGGTVQVRDYDGVTNACVLAIMGSPDAADRLTLAAIENSIRNSVRLLEVGTGAALGCFIPVEIGPINSLVPLIGAVMSQGAVWVVDGDGAGRAVPQLPQTTFTGTPLLAPCPCALASDADEPRAVESALLHAPTAAQVESLAGGVVGGFGGYSGIAMWPSNAGNGHALTGSYIAGTLEQVRALALRGERPVGVLMVDVDCFKAFNDHYGHLHGDACLQKIAKALTGCLYRTSDLVARYGGEELVVLLPDTNLEGAQQVAQRMVEAVAQLGIAHQASPVAPVVTISVGVCAQIPYAGPDNASGSAALLACADAALYRAKNQGRNRWVAG